ncbi:MarR family winged helix-turn-helix transcriptional regulator [Paenibacillus sp. PL91]|uniref:MarR family winged helix-turn-helix transcriptional regulator n=1 Tax=Paenibacillus sp. PL91 TaxID=2729538 RepID=UPI00145F225C|nr:MarR family transcriptional regulator [Paenibacillus sp. PL91]MBC9202686.1 MarR family transcriptional regulator [Paenibacillus sp. PL91]
MGFDINQRSIGFLLTRTSIANKKVLNRVLLPYDVTPEQYGVLNRLCLKDGISQKQLSELIVRDQTSIGKVLDKLERKELILRKDDPSDRRAFLLYLTPKGKELAELLITHVEAIHTMASEGISDKDIEVFVRVINKLYSNLSK